MSNLDRCNQSNLTALLIGSHKSGVGELLQLPPAHVHICRLPYQDGPWLRMARVISVKGHGYVKASEGQGSFAESIGPVHTPEARFRSCVRRTARKASRGRAELFEDSRVTRQVSDNQNPGR